MEPPAPEDCRPCAAGAWIPREWTPVLDVHPTALCPDCLTGYAWLQFPARIREVHRQWLEFWYDPPGCALTDEELGLLRRIAADEPVMFQAEARTVPAHHAFDHRVDVLRDLRKAGWIVLEIWRRGDRGHARRRYCAAQAGCTPVGREARAHGRIVTFERIAVTGRRQGSE